MGKVLIGQAQATKVKSRLLRMHYESGVGHLGGNLSCIDILLSLYHDVMAPGDEFVLSKGHAAGALYVTLWSKGLIAEAELESFHREGTRLSGHPPASGIDEIAFATGSLGHGLSLAAGLALANRFKTFDPPQNRRVFCLTSDGEWNEGSTWEALIFAAHQRLSDLVVIVDLNGLQGFGPTREVANLDSLADKLRTFGVRVVEVDGHDHAALVGAMGQSAVDDSGPLFVIARTHKGAGVSFMQDRMEWHYLPLSEAQYRQALAELDECATSSANQS